MKILQKKQKQKRLKHKTILVHIQNPYTVGDTAERYILPVVSENLSGTMMKVESLGDGDSIWFEFE